MTRQTQQLETSMFVRSWGLALNSTSHVHRPIHRAGTSTGMHAEMQLCHLMTEAEPRYARMATSPERRH